jgi:hypothetical protein
MAPPKPSSDEDEVARGGSTTQGVHPTTTLGYGPRFDDGKDRVTLRKDWVTTGKTV